MSRAHQCDGCGDLHEGPPKLSISVKLSSGSKVPGLLGNLLVNGDTQVELDFCSLECLQDHDMNAEKDELLAGVGNKDQLLEQ